MTPAIICAEKHKIPFKIHEYSHDSSNASYGAEAAEKMNIDANKIFKTLVVNLDNKELAVAIIPVMTLLSMKLIAKALKAKKAIMADKLDVQRSTGYVLGGVSPLGQKKRLKTVMDLSASTYSSIFVSAGRRGLELELCPHDLAKHLNAEITRISQ